MALNTTGSRGTRREVNARRKWRLKWYILTLNLLGIGSAGVVSVDLLCRGALVEGNKSLQKVVTGSIVIIAASEIGEVISQWRTREFFHE